MKLLDRNITLIVNYFLDNICPPVLRDKTWFMHPIIRFAYKHESKMLIEFKDKFPFMSDAELAQCYRRIINEPINTDRKTDLNKQCLLWILKTLSNENGTVLDAACGRGYLLEKLIEENSNLQCTGVDIAPPADIARGGGV
ncbi:MAG: class I SAM-dependent methyltransferase [Spirochaetaceae bacterium]|jgi:SAM-dependent methyltransferase|nr:class I SAM-dependent methyltransferase [Spirochaetaceae bacterium]